MWKKIRWDKYNRFKKVIVNTVYFLIIAQKRCERKLDETSTID